MKKLFHIVLAFYLFGNFQLFSQVKYNTYLYNKSKFNRYFGVEDVWGIKINNTNYALATLDKGLSIISTSNLSSPGEVAHINRVGYIASDPNTSIRLNTPDVETFEKNGTVYAYLATNKTTSQDPEMPLVLIVNLNAAINTGGTILIDPDGAFNSVYVGKIIQTTESPKSHTLTIAGGYLYVAGLTKYISVWNLNNTPASPTLVDTISISTTNNQGRAGIAVHELFAKSLSATTAKLYVAGSNAGIQVLDITLNTNSVAVNSRVEQLYDSDRASATTVQSTDANFDYIFTHSAWPTDDGQYVFTTDELAADPDYPNLYSPNDINLYASNGVLKSPRRIGAFLRTWKTSLLGTSTSLKGGYYVPELSTTGMTSLSQIDTNWIPNTIHQMFVRGKYVYVSHYTQGFRVMNISNPESPIEDGYYDDFTQSLSIDPANSLFFRKRVDGWPNWALGIYGVFPDADRPGIVYAGGTDGLYIFGFLPQLAENNQTISSSATAKEGQRKIVQDASGNYHIVFYSYGEIFYRKYIGGVGQTPIKISYDNDNNNYPSIAVGSTNQVMITWQRSNGTSYDVYFSMSTDGGSTWNNKYLLTSSVSTTSNPTPVIIYNSTSLRKTICYVTNSGLYSKHTTTSFPTSAAN